MNDTGQHGSKRSQELLWYCGLAAAPAGVLLCLLAEDNTALIVTGLTLLGWSVLAAGLFGRRRRGWSLHLFIVLGTGIGIMFWIAGRHPEGPWATTHGVVRTMGEGPLISDNERLYCVYTVNGMEYVRRVEQAGVAVGDTLLVRYTEQDPSVMEFTREK